LENKTNKHRQFSDGEKLMMKITWDKMVKDYLDFGHCIIEKTPIDITDPCGVVFVSAFALEHYIYRLKDKGMEQLLRDGLSGKLRNDDPSSRAAAICYGLKKYKEYKNGKLSNVQK